jgi:2Fe-2S ferredoxin
MEGATTNSVSGIDADCGGACACATCHVYIEKDWLARIPAAEEAELAMLDCTANVTPASRLSCQIKVTGALAGLQVCIPQTQK